MSKETISSNKAILVLVVIAILISAGTIFQTVTIIGELRTLSESVEDLEEMLGQPTPEGYIPNPDTVTYVFPRSTEKLDPPLATGESEAPVVMQCFQTLVRYKDTSLEEFIGEVAESWEASSDGYTWTFHIRPGLKFKNGDSLNATAVEYSFNRTLALPGFGSAVLSFILEPNGIEVVDASTLRIHVYEGGMIGMVLPVLANHYSGSIVNPNVVEAHGGAVGSTDWMAKNAAAEAGSGPYYVAKHEHGVELILDQNPNYFRGHEKSPKHVKFVIIPEIATRIMLLKKGDIDIYFDFPGVKVPELLETDVELINLGALRGGFANVAIGIGQAQLPGARFPMLADVRVRQAIAWAIDYDAALAVAYGGWAVRPYSNIPSGVPFHHSFTEYYAPAPDYDKARDLLGQVNPDWANGGPDNIIFKLEMNYLAGVEVERMQAVIIQSSLRQIGIDLELLPHDTAMMMAYITGDDMCMAFGRNPPLVPHPSYYEAHFRTGSYANWGRYSNSTVDALMSEARSIADLEEQEEIWYKIQEMLLQDVARAPVLSSPFMLVATQPWIDFVEHPFAAPWIWNATKGW